MSQVLEVTRALLLEACSSEDAYSQNLADLGAIVAQSAQDEQYRQSLVVEDKALESTLLEILQQSFLASGSSLSDMYVRSFRGCLLLLRNIASTQMLVGSTSLSIAMLESMQRYVNQPKNTGFHKALVVAYFQAMSNLSIREESDSLDTVQVQDITDVAGYVDNVEKVALPLVKELEALVHPFAIFIQNTFRAKTFFSLLKEGTLDLVEWVVHRFDKMDTDSVLSAPDLALLGFAQNLISHESFNKYLKRAYDTSQLGFTRMVKFGQIIVTSKDNWDNFQTTAILAWVFDFYKLFADMAQEILPQKQFDTQKLEYIHANIVALLDCMSDLGKFNSARQFLEHYDALKPLIALLGCVQENVARKTLKKIEAVDDNVSKKFPQVKSLIIEIISYISHESFEMQEKVREYHGLELVLSNCMIDENDPFIKERAIVCVKILLDKNQGNQLFVAQLEAKQTIDDLALKEVGYEVEINDGKVQLKKTES